ncbi:MAG TPA: hypothetical protein VGN16_06620 [Acidobacteriaceae bacterium]|jgi:hypothetical protein
MQILGVKGISPVAPWLRRLRALVLLAMAAGMTAGTGSAQTSLRSFDLRTRRMDVDCDGAPTAYGPRGKKTLDYLRNAHTLGNLHAPIVGYLTEDAPPHHPVIQGSKDPAPGYYVSQTTFVDETHPDERDPLRYVDAGKINYVVLGDRARRRGARVGDFVVVYSHRTGRTAFAIVGDTGNPSGDEGSLHLLQDLGYPFHDGKDDAVDDAEIEERFYPNSNPHHTFFRTQAALNDAARKLGLTRNFPASRSESPSHPSTHPAPR